MHLKCIGVLLFFLIASSFQEAGVYPDKHLVIFEFELDDEIAPPSLRRTQKAIREAKDSGADILLIRMNTYGGQLVAADSIRSILLKSTIPTIVFIDNNAASAGALIAIACDRIYMTQSSNIGAATVVNQSAEALPDKYQSYMRAMMRSTAESKGRDPRIAEAMVDPSVVIKGVIDTGKVLTLTASEAMNLKFCDGIVSTVAQLMTNEGIDDYEIKTYTPTFIDKVIGLLIHPAVSSVLILVMLGGIYFELQTPGIGFPIIASLIAAVLYFAPLYLEGLAANWEILLFVAGLALIAVEVFVIPGFGIAGISGILLVMAGFVFSMVGNDGFDFRPVPSDDIIVSIAAALAGMLGAVLPALLFGQRLLSSKFFRRIVLSAELLPHHRNSSASPIHSSKELIGKTGISVSVLNPGGKIEIEDEIYQAIAQVGYIERGKQIKVIADEGMNLLVREIL